MTIQTHKEAILSEVLGSLQEIESAVNRNIERTDLFKKQMDEITETWALKNIEQSEKIINAALVTAKKIIDNQVEASINNASKKIEDHIKKINLITNEYWKKMNTLIMISVIVQCLIVTSAYFIK